MSDRIFVISHIRKLIEHSIYSNFLVSLAVGMFCIGISHQLKIPHGGWYGLFVFSSTLLTYNTQRLIKARKITSISNHTNWIFQYKSVVFLFILIGAAGSAISFIKIYHPGIYSLLLLSFSSGISLFYVLPVHNKSLRDIPFLKIYLITLVCMSAVGYFELINETIYTWKNWWFVSIHFFYFIAVTIPFDIRDLPYDNPEQRTIPQIFGIKRAILLSVLLLIIYIILIVIVQPSLITNYFFITIQFITFFLLLFSNEKRSEFYYSGLIESSIFLVGLSFWIG